MNKPAVMGGFFCGKNMEKREKLKSSESGEFISRKMIIKIGTSSITKDGSPLNLTFMDDIARQVSILFKAGVKVAIISSGAVDSGRKVVPKRKGMVSKQAAAMYGQPKLIYAWIDAFERYGIPAAEVLLTKRDLKKSKAPFLEGMKYGIPIGNENDVVNNEELKKLLVYGDNDKLASRVARKLVEADTLLFLTDTDGVFDSSGNVVRELDKSGRERVLFDGKSMKGSGGMETKVKAGHKAARKGIRTVIANAYEEDVVIKVARGEKLGTTLVA